MEKLTISQLYVLEVLSKGNCKVSPDGTVTGRGGIKLNLNTVKSLEKRGMIKGGEISYKWKVGVKKLFENNKIAIC